MTREVASSSWASTHNYCSPHGLLSTLLPVSLLLLPFNSLLLSFSRLPHPFLLLLYVFILLVPPARRFARTAATRLLTIFNHASRAAIHNPTLPRHISTGDRPESPLSTESADTLYPLCVTCRWTTDIAAIPSSLSFYLISILRFF